MSIKWIVSYAIGVYYLMYNPNPGLSIYLTNDSNYFSLYIVKPNKYEVNACSARDSWLK